MRKKIFILFLFVSGVLYSQIAKRPVPEKLYNNLSKEFPQFINPAEAQQLEEKLEQFSNETSNQICVVIVDDLNGLEAADYATKIINEWGVGKKGKDNGLVILIKPTGTAGGRDIFIGVGYGLEGAIPDLATKRILDEEIFPRLKSGENFQALDNGTSKLMQLAKGEIDVKDYTRKYQNEHGVSWPLIIFVILIIIFSIRRFRGGGGGHTYSRGGRQIFWGGGMGGGRSPGGSWGGFGGGRSGGGGSGGKW